MLKYISLSLFVILLGCASGNREEREKIRHFVSENKQQEALTLLEQGEIKKDKHQKLLYQLELAKIYHNLGEYKISADYLATASELSQSYYTKSIAQKASSYVLNDNYENYYGEIFERSLMHFYQALNFYMIYQTGIEAGFTQDKDKKTIIERKTISEQARRQYLGRARAEILAWDTFFQDIQRSSRYDTIYKTDLMVKIFGGVIHEAMEKSSDQQIALQLYKDALKVLKYLGATYPSYNLKDKDFLGKFVKAENKFEWKIPENIFVKTSQFSDLNDFLVWKILKLTKNIRSTDYSKMLKELNPSDAVKAELNSNATPNVTIVLQEGLVAEKKPDKFNFGLHGLLNNIEDPQTRASVHRIGSDVLTIFMVNVLGLLPKKGPITYSQFAGAEVMGRISAELVSIEFEIPKVDAKAVNDTVTVEFKNKATSQVYKKNSPLMAPLSDIASQAVEERVYSTLMKTGTRVAIKHLVAILAAHKIYESNKQNNPLAAKYFALASYLAASRGIAASEKADVRYWSTLPNSLRISQLALPAGEYEVSAEIKSEKSSQAKTLGTVTVTPKGQNIFSYSI
ncbi:MAG: hypothetical protein JNM93_13825 [Bacteriovoracaceae bacterium]|nr:hypothetical protein [Bacteriovoracaceae bacterium]